MALRSQPTVANIRQAAAASTSGNASGATSSRSASPDDADLRAAIVQTADRLLARDLVEGTAGNISTRSSSGRILVTPTSLPYEQLEPGDIVEVALDGTASGSSRHAPTSEIELHLACLRSFPEISAVVHSHAVHASAFAVANEPIPCALEEMALYIGGEVPIAKYQLTGSRALADEATRHLSNRSAVLLANHGMLTVGQSLDEALFLTALVERCARIVLAAKSLGSVRALPDESCEALSARYRDHRAARRPVT